MLRNWFSATLVLAYGGGWALHWWHREQAENVAIPPVLHWLRDSSLAIPLALVAVAVAGAVVSRLQGLWQHPSALGEAGTTALLASTVYAVGSVPGNLLHARLFVSEHARHAAGNDVAGPSGAEHLLADAGVAFAAGALCLLLHAVSLELARLRHRLDAPPSRLSPEAGPQA